MKGQKSLYKFDPTQVKIPVRWSLLFADDPEALRTVGTYAWLKHLSSAGTFNNFRAQSRSGLAHRFGVSHSTMIRRAEGIVRMNLGRWEGKRLRLISWPKAKEMYRAIERYHRTDSEGLDAKETADWMKSLAIHEKQRQMQTKLNKVHEGERRGKARKLLLSETAEVVRVSLGTKGVARMFGRTHYMTGVRIEKKLEAKGLLTVTRFKPTLHDDCYMGGFEVPKPYFIFRGKVFEGKCNELFFRRRTPDFNDMLSELFSSLGKETIEEIKVKREKDNITESILSNKKKGSHTDYTIQKSEITFTSYTSESISNKINNTLTLNSQRYIINNISHGLM